MFRLTPLVHPIKDVLIEYSCDAESLKYFKTECLSYQRISVLRRKDSWKSSPYSWLRVFKKDFLKIKNKESGDKLHFKVKIFSQEWLKLNPNYDKQYGEDGLRLSDYFLDFLSSCQLQLYETMDFSDLIVETSDKEILKAHKAMLTSRSEVFDSMLKINMKEQLNGKIIIDDVHSKVMKKLLRFIYCGHVGKIKEINIELYKAAHRYQIKNLPNICLRSIFESLNETNAIKTLQFACMFEHEDLYDYAISMIGS